MGLPAVKRDQGRVAPQRPRLSLVPPSRCGVSRANAASAARCRDAFSAFVIALVLISSIGLGRVALSAKAAELALDSGRLRKEVAAQRWEGDMLQIQQSVLGTPSRIEDIACETMNMAEALSVSYIRLDDPASPCESMPDAGAGVVAADDAGEDAPFVASVLGLIAGEAKILLVGDVGLASSR